MKIEKNYLLEYAYTEKKMEKKTNFNQFNLDVF